MTQVRLTGEAGRMPSTYLWWLFGVIWTLGGMAVLTFGLVWVATGISGSAAGLVLSAGVIPRLILSLPGGSIADRFGAWPVMVFADCIMAVLAIALVIAISLVGTPLWLLVTVSAVVGVADAFYRPASGAFPRYLVPAPAMAQASAARQIVFQLIGVTGPVLGGILIVAASLAASAAAAAAGFAVMFLILLALRNRLLPVTRSPIKENLASSVGQGLRYAIVTTKVRIIIILLVAITGFVLPLTSLLIPLHVRDQAWLDVTAGFLVGSYGAGLLLSTLLFLFRPHSALTQIPSLGGLALTGIAMLAIALAPTPEVACIVTLAAGLGTGHFIARVAPALLTDVPDEYLSRIQGINVFVQTLPLLFTNSIFGWISDSLGTGTAIVVAAIGLLVIAIGTAFSAPARRL
ncbi:MFS transporter [Saxibacter everestensis]|uniref:MFS transporter n=1 Tax=Saxibacter everestensis TaxID=2909229 RepID=A0ABY8QX30_9MICO|nr:MFS transporter [Brevibacteriaceae bacterium ZFBP1038]